MQKRERERRIRAIGRYVCARMCDYGMVSVPAFKKHKYYILRRYGASFWRIILLMNQIDQTFSLSLAHSLTLSACLSVTYTLLYTHSQLTYRMLPIELYFTMRIHMKYV